MISKTTPTCLPDLIGKQARLENLKKQPSLNGRFGLVIGWNQETERFGLKVAFGSIVKWVKPINLHYMPSLPINQKEEELMLLSSALFSHAGTNVEDGIRIFDQMESETENYMVTYMKLTWIKMLLKTVAGKDDRYLPKIRKILEQGPANSSFPDLKIKGKLWLSYVISHN